MLHGWTVLVSKAFCELGDIGRGGSTVEMLAGRALIVSLLLVGIAVILDCSDAMVAKDQRQRIPSPKGKRRGVSPGGDDLRTKASKQRGRLMMSPKSGKAMISNLVKKPALKASNAFGKTVTWAQVLFPASCSTCHAWLHALYVGTADIYKNVYDICSEGFISCRPILARLHLDW